MPDPLEDLHTLLAAPDRRQALEVYADWLEEQDDPRTAYTRLQLTARDAPDTADWHALRRLYPSSESVWLGKLELSGAFTSNLLPQVPSAWWGVGIGTDVNDVPYTAYIPATIEDPCTIGEADKRGTRLADNAPPPLPLERFDGTLEWLRAEKPAQGETHVAANEWDQRLRELQDQGFRVPRALWAFLCEPELHANIPSCTANFVMSPAQSRAQELEGDLLLPFYCDQQWCLLWGVRLSKNDAYAPVLAGVPHFMGEVYGVEEVVFAASGVEAFLYRWRIENAIWSAENSGRRRTEAEDAYAAFFLRRAGGPG